MTFNWHSEIERQKLKEQWEDFDTKTKREYLQINGTDQNIPSNFDVKSSLVMRWHLAAILESN